MTAIEVTEAALSLDEEERYALLERLRESIPGSDPAVWGTNADTAWQRLQEHQAHPGPVTPWRDALSHLRTTHGIGTE